MAGDRGPNHANFRSPIYDELFEVMKSRLNDPVRAEAIAKMLDHLEEANFDPEFFKQHLQTRYLD